MFVRLYIFTVSFFSYICTTQGPWSQVVNYGVMRHINVLEDNSTNPALITIPMLYYKLLFAGLMTMVGVLIGIFCAILIRHKEDGIAYQRELVIWVFFSFFIITYISYIGGSSFQLFEIFKVGIKSKNIHLFTNFGFMVGAVYFIIKDNIVDFFSFTRPSN